jgi:hypothetical protein
MISLKAQILQLLNESSEEDINADLWDNWYSYLKENDCDITREEIKKLLKKFDLTKNIINNKIVILSDSKNKAYLEYSAENDTFDFISDIDDWAVDLDDSEMEGLIGMSVDNIYNGWCESTLDDIKKNPGKVYHYTTEENWDAIKTEGVLKQSSGTGLTNRYSHGIFTSINPEEHAVGSYGNVCLEIDLETYKNDNKLSELSISYEPDVDEYLLRHQTYHVLELDTDRIDLSSDMSPYTLIISHNIPIKYIKEI